MNPDCPTCGGETKSLGILGRIHWLECIDCGAQIAHTLTSEEQADLQATPQADSDQAVDHE